MLYVDLTELFFSMTLTLGDEDTNSPPPLLLSLNRKGTNFSKIFDLAVSSKTPGDRYLIFPAITTSIFIDPQGERQSGQYNYAILDNTVPATPVEIESGLLIATTTPITKTEYGTDKIRAEYKGHI